VLPFALSPTPAGMVRVHHMAEFFPLGPSSPTFVSSSECDPSQFVFPLRGLVSSTQPKPGYFRHCFSLVSRPCGGKMTWFESEPRTFPLFFPSGQQRGFFAYTGTPPEIRVKTLPITKGFLCHSAVIWENVFPLIALVFYEGHNFFPSCGLLPIFLPLALHPCPCTMVLSDLLWS